jgi:hypothetical protein
VVVDVSLLLDFSHDQAAAMPACNQAREGKVMLCAAVFLGVAAIEHVLNSLPKFR